MITDIYFFFSIKIQFTIYIGTQETRFVFFIGIDSFIENYSETDNQVGLYY